MSSTQTDPAAPAGPPVGGPRRRLRPERRRRGDVVAVAVIAIVVVVVGLVLWRTSPVTATVDDPAAAPIGAPPAAGGVPAAFTEAWRSPSGATSGPVASGTAAVTADGSTVVGHDAVTGAERWRYSRDLPLCTAVAGFPSADNGVGRLLALYHGGDGGCSELTALRPDTGARAASSNPDSQAGTQLLSDGSFVVSTGATYLEVWRSDLVRTLEYGAVTTPVQLGEQPRTGCTYGSTALMSGRLGVVERCPGESADRLTVMSPDGSNGAEKPQVEFSMPLPARGATVVALSAESVAVALPDPARLLVLDRTGHQTALVALDVPDSDLVTTPRGTVPGGGAVVSSDADRVYWWTGSETVALDTTGLTPVWTAPGTLGPALTYGGGLLVPVTGGLARLDPQRGTTLSTIPVNRADRSAPVRLAALGEVLLEQRGSEVVALAPAP